MTVGSFVNRVSASVATPEVGMGVTFLLWSDRHGGTVVEVRSDRQIVVQEDFAKRVDSNGMSESQEYEFSPNVDAPRLVYTLRSNGQWVLRGSSMKNGPRIAVGYRSEFYDYSF